jgi:hypothetical protein
MPVSLSCTVWVGELLVFLYMRFVFAYSVDALYSIDIFLEVIIGSFSLEFY